MATFGEWSNAMGTNDVNAYWKDQQSGFKAYNSTKSTSSSSDGFNWNGVASLLPALTSLLGVSAQAEDIRRRGEATVKTIEGLGDALAFSTSQKGYQLRQLDAALGDKLSQQGLESLKAEARLKAAAAETGATGTAVSENLENVYTQENLQNAQIVRDFRNAKDSTKMSMVADLLNFQRQTDSIIYSMQSPLSAGLQTFGAGLQFFKTGLNLLPSNIQDISLGVDTKG